MWTKWLRKSLLCNLHYEKSPFPNFKSFVLRVLTQSKTRQIVSSHSIEACSWFLSLIKTKRSWKIIDASFLVCNLFFFVLKRILQHISLRVLLFAFALSDRIVFHTGLDHFQIACKYVWWPCSKQRGKRHDWLVSIILGRPETSHTPREKSLFSGLGNNFEPASYLERFFASDHFLRVQTACSSGTTHEHEVRLLGLNISFQKNRVEKLNFYLLIMGYRIFWTKINGMGS